MPADAQRTETALLIGAAQILWMDVPDHAAVDLSVRLVQADRRAANYAGLVNAVLRRCAREGAQLLAGTRAATPDMPALADGALARALRRRDRARHCAAPSAMNRALDITVKSDPRQIGGAPAWRSVADRQRAHHAARTGHAAARLRRRPMVGAGRRRGAAGAAVRRRQRQIHRRSLRRARRQDGAARAGRRRGHRDRSLAGAAARACATISRGSTSHAEIVAADAAEWHGGPFDACWSTRPAPRPARSAAIPTSPG